MFSSKKVPFLLSFGLSSAEMNADAKSICHIYGDSYQKGFLAE